MIKRYLLLSSLLMGQTLFASETESTLLDQYSSDEETTKDTYKESTISSNIGKKATLFEKVMWTAKNIYRKEPPKNFIDHNEILNKPDLLHNSSWKYSSPVKPSSDQYMESPLKQSPIIIIASEKLPVKQSPVVNQETGEKKLSFLDECVLAMKENERPKNLPYINFLLSRDFYRNENGKVCYRVPSQAKISSPGKKVTGRKKKVSAETSCTHKNPKVSAGTFKGLKKPKS